MKDGFMLFGYDRRRTSTLTLDSQPGAHTGATRKYIPGYSDSNIVFLNTSTGNDANTGASIAQALLTYSAAATAAGSTKKIRLVNSATLTSNITKPTEATIGTTSTISSTTSSAVDVLTGALTPSFGGSSVFSVIWVPKLSKFIASGASAKVAYSSNGDAWTQASTLPSGNISRMVYAESFGLIVGVGDSVYYSSDGNVWYTATDTGAGATWSDVSFSESLGLFVAITATGLYRSTDGLVWALTRVNDFYGDCVLWVNDTGKFIAAGHSGNVLYSSDGISWHASSSVSAFSGETIRQVAYSSDAGKYVAVAGTNIICYSADADSWTAAATPSFGANSVYCVNYVPELGLLVAGGSSGEVAFSTDGNAWTQATTTAFAGAPVKGIAYSPLLGKAVAVGDAGSIVYSTPFSTTISAAVAGFSIQAVQYSGAVTAYNCTLKQPGTTAALSLDSCRVTESGSHISNNAVTSTATLYEGDRHTTCTPASQNAIDMNLDTVGGTWYIYNASATAYERIRDCLVEGGIVANYNVTVSGRANVRGTSQNVLFGATVTHRDPKFVDTTDYALQFQSNGYARNSLAAARSALYFNSAGDARDIGAWSYVESAVSHYFAKNVYIPKGVITHSVEEVVSEQQGDSGAVSVYGNVNRIKEVITIKYNTEAEADFAVIRAMRLLTDKTVLIQLDPAWTANAGSVVANGAHSSGADVLNIDSAATFNGMTVTISGKTYYPMRAEPSLSATTRLVLDRPLEDAVSDNDVITRNYPSGAGEYQYAAQSRLDLGRVDATVLQAYRTGLIIRLVRAYQ